MYKHTHRLIISGIVLTTLALAAAGCNLGQTLGTPTQPPDAAYTQAAQTIIAELTLAVSGPADTLVASLPVETGVSAVITPSETPAPPPASPTLEPSLTLQPTNTPTHTPPPTVMPGSVIPGRLVFEDDFSSEDWYVDSNDDFSFEYVDDAYVIFVNLLNAPIWSVFGGTYLDVRLEVEGARTDGPQSGYYGLTCRHVDGENYYALLVGPDGSYGIGKMLDGEFEFIEQSTDNAGIIQRGSVSNRVRADCIGNRLSLYANGQLLLEVQDADLEEGEIGLLVKTRLETGLEVTFDRYAVYEP